MAGCGSDGTCWAARFASIRGTSIGRGLLTNPNLMVLGQVGRGKSTFVKTFIWRQVAFGRQVWIVDPKGEYGATGRGVREHALHLAPGGSVRLNPLDLALRAFRGSGHPASSAALMGRHPGPTQAGRRPAPCVGKPSWSARWRHLVPGSTARSRRSGPRWSWPCGPSWPACRRPTLPDLVTALLDPDPELAADGADRRRRPGP